jgi:O-acetyl-ADP-ribose deacetylase (regulator of RNase III)
MAEPAENLNPSGVTYVTGDATNPEGEGLKIITHCCNNVGGWGKGFVLALTKRWSRPETAYREWYELHGTMKFRKMLGAMQLVPVENDIYVANILGQHGTGGGEKPPIRYEAISKGFKYIAQHALTHPEKNISVHMPRIGCSLAGGSWSEIEILIDQHFVTNGIPVTVYDWPGGTFNP